ncbi:MAG: Fibronectin type domain protein, partial [Myxococcaceae bacterium]|nr:Fibronectin type domain protein [Myxococcaceae bacterium]
NPDTQTSTLGGGYTVAFDPRDWSSGVALSLRADLGVTLGTGVAAWTDQSPAARVYSQATGTKQPTVTALINSKATLSHAGASSQFLQNTTPFALTVGHLLMVAQLVADPPAVHTGGLRFGSGSGDHYPFTDGVIYDSFGTTTRKTTVNPAASLAAAHCYEVVSKTGGVGSASFRTYLNGTLLFTNPGATTVGWEPAGSLIGASTDVAGIVATRYMNGAIAELVILDHEATAGEYTDWKAYVLRYYGVVM